MARMAEERTREAAERQAESERILGERGVEHRQRELDKEKVESIAHLRNLHHDENFDGKVLHFLDNGETTFGRKDARPLPNVTLGGLSIQQRHCVVRNGGSGAVKLSPLDDDAKVFVNGRPLAPGVPTTLNHADRVVIGVHHIFLFIDPLDVTFASAELPTHEMAIREKTEYEMKEQREAEARERVEQEARQAEREEALREMQEELERHRQAAERNAAEMAAQQATVGQGMLDQQKLQLEAEYEARMAKEKERMKEMERKLKERMERTTEEAKQQEQKRQFWRLMDDKLLKALPLVNEANLISQELAAGTEFSLKLLPSKYAVSMVGVNALEPFERIERAVLIAVRPPAGDGGGGGSGGDDSMHERMWSVAQFTERLYQMRELHERWCEEGRNTAAAEAMRAAGEYYVAFNVDGDQVLIGGAAVWLTPLTHHLEIDDWVAVIGYQGQRRGEVKVKLVPELQGGDGVEIDEYVLLEKGLLAYHGATLKLAISVVDVRGLPESLNNELVGRFKFFNESKPFETPCGPVRVFSRLSPSFSLSLSLSLSHTCIRSHHHHHHPSPSFSQNAKGVPYGAEVQVTPKLIEYIEEHALEVEIFGTPHAHAPVGPRPQAIRDGDDGSEYARGASVAASPRYPETPQHSTPRSGDGGAAMVQVKNENVALRAKDAAMTRAASRNFQVVLAEGILVKKHPVRPPFCPSPSLYRRVHAVWCVN